MPALVLDSSNIDQFSRALARKDPRIGKLIRRVGPCTLQLGRQGDALTALVRSIVFQQLSGKAAATIFGRVLSLLPASSTPPTASDWLSLDAAELREAGLSRQKISYLSDLCNSVKDGRLDLGAVLEMPDDRLVEAIVGVKGFGTWSAQMFLLFHLGRADVWPYEDLGIRKAIASFDGLSELPKPSEIKSRGNLWCPYRSLASWYLWRLLDSGLGDVGW